MRRYRYRMQSHFIAKQVQYLRENGINRRSIKIEDGWISFLATSKRMKQIKEDMTQEYGECEVRR